MKHDISSSLWTEIRRVLKPDLGEEEGPSQSPTGPPELKDPKNNQAMDKNTYLILYGDEDVIQQQKASIKAQVEISLALPDLGFGMIKFRDTTDAVVAFQ